MKSSFYIKDEGLSPSREDVLAIQIGDTYCAYAITDPHTNQLVKAEWLLTDTYDKNALAEIVDKTEYIVKQYKKIFIAFDTAHYTLLPAEFSLGDNSPLLHITKASSQDHIIHEKISEAITIFYTVPFGLLNWCITTLPGADYWNMQTFRVRYALSQDDQQDMLYVDVVDKQLSVVAVQNGTLLLAQRYTYETPSNALYYLLKICQIHGLDQNTVQLKISGLINREAVLYRKFYEYFLHVDFLMPGWKFSGEAEIPFHYFTSLNLLSNESN